MSYNIDKTYIQFQVGWQENFSRHNLTFLASELNQICKLNVLLFNPWVVTFYAGRIWLLHDLGLDFIE